MGHPTGYVITLYTVLQPCRRGSYLITSHDQPVVVIDSNGVDYTFSPGHIARSAVIHDTDPTRPDTCSLTANLVEPFLTEVSMAATEGLEVLIREIRTQTLKPSYSAADLVTIFWGEVVRSARRENTIELECNSFRSRTRFEVPAHAEFRRNQCQWVLYDEFTCRLDIADFTYSGVVSKISQNRRALEATGLTGTAGRYAGGVLLLSDDRKIGIHSDKSVSGARRLELFHRLPDDLVVGASVSAAWGCDRSFQDCTDPFENGRNFGGFPYATFRNPHAENVG